MKNYRRILLLMFIFISIISTTPLKSFCVYAHSRYMDNIYQIYDKYIYKLSDEYIEIINVNDYYDMEHEHKFENEKLKYKNIHIYGDRLFISGIKEEDNRSFLKIIVYDVFDKKNPIIINEFEDYGYNYFLKERDGVIYVCFQKNDSLISVISFDLNKQEIHPNICEFESEESNFIYLSDDSIYVVCNEDMVDRRFTTIHKLNVNRDDISYVNKISFDGNILNEKFINEYDNNLRVVGYCDNYKNKIYIFDKDLMNVNCIDIILEDENINNIYFDKEFCYIGGFLKEGYFSVYNLNYNNPKEIGRINLSSSLSYIYKFGENKFIIIGNDHRSDTYKNIQSDKVYEILKNTGIKIDLIDVSDKTNPKIFDEYFIKGTDVYSPAFENEDRLIYYDDKNILVFPLDISNYNIDIDINSAMEVFNNFNKNIFLSDEKTFTGVYVFDLDDNNGIGLRFIIDSDMNNHVDKDDIEFIKIYGDNIFIFRSECIEVFDLYGGLLGEYEFIRKETNLIVSFFYDFLPFSIISLT